MHYHYNLLRHTKKGFVSFFGMLLLSLFFATSSLSYAESLVDAAHLIDKGKCAEGVEVITTLIDQSNDAKYLLGVMYNDGTCVEKDASKSFHIMKQLADVGYSDAYTFLGLMYYKGNGVEKNISIAVDYYNKAVATGDAYAEYCIAAAYFNKSWVNYSPKQGVSWFKKSALKKYKNSCLALIRIYENGMGVAVSQDEADYWGSVCN